MRTHFLNRMVIATFISVIARLFNSITEHRFCFSAISSAGIVGILPGFIVCESVHKNEQVILLSSAHFIVIGSLELAAGNIPGGGSRLVLAIACSVILVGVLLLDCIAITSYSLFKAYCLMLGSDIAFGLLPSFRAERNAMSAYLAHGLQVNGFYRSDNVSTYSNLTGTWSFLPYYAGSEPITQFHYVMEGCYRDPSRSWLYLELPWQTQFVLAPLFVLCLSLLNGQRWRAWVLPVQVGIGCAGFASEHNSVWAHTPTESSWTSKQTCR